jgi:cytoskeletal protein CcmA (bactofilin family)
MPPIRGISKMFKKSEPNSTRADTGSEGRTATPVLVGRKPEPTPIGPSLRIKGEITGNQDLVVYGHIEGSIDLGDGLLVVTKDGRVDADIRARVITVEGRAEGDLRAQEQIIVRQSGQVRGSVAAPRIALDFGCSFSGAIETDRAEDSGIADSNDNIADFKAAISGTAQSKAGAGKSSPR